MPSVTPLYSLPYPLAADAVAGLDETFRALVDRLEVVLAAASQPPLTPSDFASTVSAIAAFNAGPVAVSSPFAPAAGWGLTGTMWAWQKMRMCNFTITNNTGAAIACSATTGLLTGAPVVGTVLAGHRPQSTTAVVHTSNAGTTRILTTSGTMSFQTYIPGVAFPAGSNVNGGAVWLVP